MGLGKKNYDYDCLGEKFVGFLMNQQINVKDENKTCQEITDYILLRHYEVEPQIKCVTRIMTK